MGVKVGKVKVGKVKVGKVGKVKVRKVKVVKAFFPLSQPFSMSLEHCPILQTMRKWEPGRVK